MSTDSHLVLPNLSGLDILAPNADEISVRRERPCAALSVEKNIRIRNNRSNINRGTAM